MTKRRSNSFVWRQITAAYGGYLKWLGILIGAVALGNWLVENFSIPLTRWLSVALSFYRDLFYPVLDFLLRWVDIPLTPATKDAILLYSAMGGVCSRTTFAYFSEIRGYFDYHYGTWFEAIETIHRNKLQFALLLSLVFLLWPVALLFLFLKPVLAINQDGELVLWTAWRDIKDIRVDLYEDHEPDVFREWKLIDARFVFILQALAMIVVSIVLVITNNVIYPATN